jgi:hypothetical protein
MNLYTVCSTKGSPGATVLSLALTCALVQLHGTDVALVEADPAGGDLAAFLGLPTDPGMASLAAASRHQSAWPDARAHAQGLPTGGWTLLGSTDPGQAAASVSTLATRLHLALASTAAAAVVDCGRWQTACPAGALVNGATATIVCVRPSVAAIEAVRVRAEDLWQATDGRLGLAVMGETPYGPDEVEAATGLPVLAMIPFDRRGRDALLGGQRVRAVERLPMVRAARSLLDRLRQPADELASRNGAVA